MSYTPTSWSTGDTITAAAMNKIENGIANAGGGGGVVLCTDTEGTLDKSYNDIMAAIASLSVPILSKDGFYYAFGQIDNDDDYEVFFGPIRYFNVDADGLLVLD